MKILSIELGNLEKIATHVVALSEYGKFVNSLKLDWVSNPKYSNILCWHNNTNKVFTTNISLKSISLKSILIFIKMLYQLRKENYDLAITPDTFFYKLLLFFIKAKHISIHGFVKKYTNFSSLASLKESCNLCCKIQGEIQFMLGSEVSPIIGHINARKNTNFPIVIFLDSITDDKLKCIVSKLSIYMLEDIALVINKQPKFKLNSDIKFGVKTFYNLSWYEKAQLIKASTKIITNIRDIFFFAHLLKTKSILIHEENLIATAIDI